MKPGSIFAKALWILKYQGLVELWKRVWRYIKKHKLSGLWRSRNNAAAYRRWLKNEATQIKEKISSAQRDIESFEYLPVISIVMPVRNTMAKYLERAINSVVRQVYPYWELCIADDASTESHVASILKRCHETDSRIKVTFLSCHGGIVGASNQAIILTTGDYVGFLDHDDELAPHALLEIVRLLNRVQDAELIYTDEDHLIGNKVRCEPYFKPDWSPDLLLSMNYIGHFIVARRSLLQKLGGFQEGIDGYQSYDLVLRMSEMTKKICHVPQILYHRRSQPRPENKILENNNSCITGVEIVKKALERRGLEGEVQQVDNGRYHVRYSIQEEDLVSIIIPTRDKAHLLKRCIKSIREKSSYSKYEIVVIDNGSVEEETAAYFQKLERLKNFRIIHCNEPFNYSKINNTAVRETNGKYLLFLNNDTEVITVDWLEELLSHCQRPEIGAVGAKLLFPDGNVQHAGVIVGLFGAAGHTFYGKPVKEKGYMGFASVIRNYSAVTAACLMMRRDAFNEVGGFDETLDVALNDIDLCLKVIKKGYFIVWTPQALLYHHEFATRGLGLQENNIEYFCQKWRDYLIQGDPFYNSNLSLSHHDFRIKQ